MTTSYIKLKTTYKITESGFHTTTFITSNKPTIATTEKTLWSSPYTFLLVTFTKFISVSITEFTSDSLIFTAMYAFYHTLICT